MFLCWWLLVSIIPTILPVTHHIPHSCHSSHTRCMISSLCSGLRQGTPTLLPFTDIHTNIYFLLQRKFQKTNIWNVSPLWGWCHHVGLQNPQWRTQEFFSGGGGSTNSIEDRGQRGRGSGGRSPLVRDPGGSCNLVQEISFHIVKFS